MEYIVLAIPLFFALMAVELAWSAWGHRRVYRLSDFVANIGCGIGSQVVGAFTKAGIFAIYLAVYDNWRFLTLPDTPLTGLVAFLLIDLLYYWFHRLSHEVNFLWAAHIVHHQSEEYNLSVALRQSWWQGLFSFWFYVPVALLGVHPVVIVTVGAFVTLYQFWIHTKAIGRMGPLERLLNTPSHHRVHHGSDPKYIDRNHAGTLIIWDKLFGTFQREEEEPTYGITVPLRSWDPLTANLHYWGDLFRLAGRCRTMADRLRVFLKHPGWRPAYLGGPERPKAAGRQTHRTLEDRPPRAVSGYVIAQFSVLVGATAVFLFRQESLEPLRQWLSAGLILWWVMNLGALLDGRRWGLRSEVGRTSLLAALIGTSGDLLQSPWHAVLAGALWIVSVVHLLAVMRHLGSPGR